MSQTRSVKQTVPFAMMVALGFFIAGFVSFALFNGLTSNVARPAYSNDWNLIFGWLAAWTVIGVLFGIYFGRK